VVSGIERALKGKELTSDESLTYNTYVSYTKFDLRGKYRKSACETAAAVEVTAFMARPQVLLRLR